MRLALTAIFMLLPATAAAHHGWTSYDESKPVTITAPLTDLEWTNPHGSARIARGDERWTVVLAPISRMEARGLTKEMLATSKPVTLTGYARRDGTREMRIERIQLSDRTIELR